MQGVVIGVLSAITTSAVISFLAYLARDLFLEKVKADLTKEQAKFLDELRWNRKVQEQAAAVAEYLALARRLKETSSESDHERANQLSWELAMWLPEEIYKEMATAIVRPNAEVNELSVTVAVRKLLLGENAGNLGADDVAHHAPGIGRKSPQQDILVARDSSSER